MSSPRKKNCPITLVEAEDRRLGPLAACLLNISRLCGVVASPLAQELQACQGSVDGDVLGVEGGDEVLFTLGLGVGLQELAAGQAGLLVGDALLVGREEGVVPFLEVLALGEQGLELGVDDLGYLGRKWLGKAIQGLAESENLDMKGGVGCVDGVGRGEALESKCVLAWGCG